MSSNSQNYILQEEFLMKINGKVIGTAVAALGAVIAGGFFSKKEKETTEETATTEATTTTETTTETEDNSTDNSAE